MFTHGRITMNVIYLQYLIYCNNNVTNNKCKLFLNINRKEFPGIKKTQEWYTKSLGKRGRFNWNKCHTFLCCSLYLRFFVRKMQSSKCPFNNQTLNSIFGHNQSKAWSFRKPWHKINCRLVVMHACESSTGDLRQENCKFKTSLNDMTKIPASEELLYSIGNISIKLNIS